ncbi:MAG: hypothetical protein USCAAHI_02303 [Beijerinckiaceae bacterium]|nr:MAG: hypothetical protein USCAAHI_02303 [Beijerinckiaceae bacterium]
MSIEAYFSIGKVIGLIVGVLIFIAAYIYCIPAYGIRFGLGLGWLPSGVRRWAWGGSQWSYGLPSLS